MILSLLTALPAKLIFNSYKATASPSPTPFVMNSMIPYVFNAPKATSLIKKVIAKQPTPYAKPMILKVSASLVTMVSPSATKAVSSLSKL
jgi:hypothetical protein